MKEHNPSVFLELNLPKADLKLRQTERGTEIYDILRKKWLLITPEEWVRQNFTSYLVNQLCYPAGRMANEIQISLNGTSKRCDTVVYNEQLQPVMIIEYKEPGVPITQKVFEQIARYNIVLQVKHLIVSNGLRHYYCEVDTRTNRYKFIAKMPSYEEIN